GDSSRRRRAGSSRGTALPRARRAPVPSTGRGAMADRSGRGPPAGLDSPDGRWGLDPPIRGDRRAVDDRDRGALARPEPDEPADERCAALVDELEAAFGVRHGLDRRDPDVLGRLEARGEPDAEEVVAGGDGVEIRSVHRRIMSHAAPRDLVPRGWV